MRTITIEVPDEADIQKALDLADSNDSIDQLTDAADTMKDELSDLDNRVDELESRVDDVETNVEDAAAVAESNRDHSNRLEVLENGAHTIGDLYKLQAHIKNLEMILAQDGFSKVFHGESPQLRGESAPFRSVVELIAQEVGLGVYDGSFQVKISDYEYARLSADANAWNEHKIKMEDDAKRAEDAKRAAATAVADDTADAEDDSPLTF